MRKEPYTTTKEPYTTAKEPYATIEETYTTVTEPYTTIKEPYITCKRDLLTRLLRSHMLNTRYITPQKALKYSMKEPCIPPKRPANTFAALSVEAVELCVLGGQVWLI